MFSTYSHSLDDIRLHPDTEKISKAALLDNFWLSTALIKSTKIDINWQWNNVVVEEI